MLNYHKTYRRKPKVKYRITTRAWVTLFVLVCLIALVLKSSFGPQKAVYPERIGQIPVVTQLVPKDYAGRTDQLRHIKWVVIHETGNTSAGADAQSHSAYLQSAAQAQEAKSWHYTVDNNIIYHHLPDNEIGWHAGDGAQLGGGNQGGIGVEICVNQDGDYQQALANAVQLVAYLLETYDLDIDAVKQHHDFMNKDCPHLLRQGDQWQWFLQSIESAMAH